VGRDREQPTRTRSSGNETIDKNKLVVLKFLAKSR
jgi:hypothetical protein